MSRLIISHVDDINGKASMWNKNTVGTEAYRAFLQNAEAAQQLNNSKVFNAKDDLDLDNRYVFLPFYELMLQDYGNWTNKYFQTIGLMELRDESYYLHSVSCNRSPSLRLEFNTHINLSSEVSSTMCARVYGFCMYYSSTDKILQVDASDLKGKPYIEMRVNHWQNLGSLLHAQRLERILHKINFANDV